MAFYANESAGTVHYSNADWQTAGIITDAYIIDNATYGGVAHGGGEDGTTYRTPLSFQLGKYERVLFRAKLDFSYLDGDMKYKITTPASSTAYRAIRRVSEDTISGEVSETGYLDVTGTGTAEVAITAADGDYYAYVDGFVEAGANAGTLAIQIGQRANHGNDTKLNEGSYLEVLRF